MKIQIDGTNTVNKGAELMLYAILEEVERRHPKAVMLYNSQAGSAKQIETSLTIKRSSLLTFWRYPRAILSKLKIKHDFALFSVYHPAKGIDILLDAGGFQFSDQWNHSDTFLKRLETYYRTLKRYGTKIILLPQAFGPFETPNGKKCTSILNKYVDILIARDSKSKQYLLDANVDEEKVWLFPDFTGLVTGIFPKPYEFSADKVCIIPNKKMFTHSPLSVERYFQFIQSIIVATEKNNKEAFLLNHEGVGDLEICKKINNQLRNPLPIISGLTSKEIKGIIGASYAVISSRFHGVASALTQGVPCVATSWSHKYELLFNDFEQYGMVLDVHNNFAESITKVSSIIEEVNNRKIRSELAVQKEKIKKLNTTMWEQIWKYVNLPNG